jgi:hypothetical protein
MSPSYYWGLLMFEESLRVTSDPLEGWPIHEVLKNKLAPKHDVYGKLFYFVRDMLEKFIIRLTSLEIEIEVHGCKAEDLANRLAGQQFDRIHVRDFPHHPTIS